jgi:hypothetical protein
MQSRQGQEEVLVAIHINGWISSLLRCAYDYLMHPKVVVLASGATKPVM